MIEFDEPHSLLSQPLSYLSKLVDYTGPVAAQRLRNMALNAHNKRIVQWYHYLVGCSRKLDMNLNY